jgi:L-asparaginase II
MIVAEVVRSGFVESVHHGAVFGRHSRGDVTNPIFPRSSNKPLQTVGMLRAGLIPREPADLALISGSHFGEPFHIRRVREILAAAGLDESALMCAKGLPLHEEARNDWLRSGGGPERVLMNCSGKHAGMLATCVANDWPLDSYRDPKHPLQMALAETVTDLVGEPIAAVGVDGCGAPVFGFSLTALARAFQSGWSPTRCGRIPSWWPAPAATTRCSWAACPVCWSRPGPRVWWRPRYRASVRSRSRSMTGRRGRVRRSCSTRCGRSGLRRRFSGP